MIGVLGGMGPAATVDFLAKLIRLTPAERDQDHVPVVVLSEPRVPDRVGPIMDGRGPSPLDALRRGIRTLERAGAGCIAIPCHTAHFWYDQMVASAHVPILHIADAVLADLTRHGATDGRWECSRPQPRSRPAFTRSAYTRPGTSAPFPLRT
jgi:aspartate racemase